MGNIESRFEIIEDEAPKPKRKKSRKPRERFSLNYVPWRLVMITLTAGMTFGIILIFFLMHSRTVVTSVPVMIDTDLSELSRQINAPIVDIDFANNDLVAVSSSNVRLYSKNNLTHILDIGGSSVSLSRDGRLLASITNAYANNESYGMVQLWDAQTGNLLKESKVSIVSESGAFSGKSAGFSPDGRLMAIGTIDGIRLLDTQSLEPQTLIPIPNISMTELAFSSGNQRLTAIIEYTGVDVFDVKTAVWVWDIHNLKTPQVVYKLVLPIFKQYGEYAALSPDGHYLAYSTWNDADTGSYDTIHIQDLTAQNEVGTMSFDIGKHIGGLALTDKHLAFSQVDTLSGEGRNLQVVQWWAGSDGLITQLLVGPQPFHSSGASQLRLWSENGTSGLDYLSIGTNTIMRWDFASNSIRALPI